MKYFKMFLSIEKLCYYISSLNSYRQTSTLTLNLVFTTTLIYSKWKLLKTILGKSDTKMVFGNGLSKNVFNCHPRNKT